MKWFNNIKIYKKLVLGFFIIAMIAAAVGFFGVNNIREIVNADKLLYEENTLGIDYIGHASTHYQNLRFYTMELLIVDNEAKYEDYMKNIQSNTAAADDYIKKYEAGIITEEDQLLFDNMNALWHQYKTLIQNVIKMVEGDQKEHALTLFLGNGDIIGNSLEISFDKMMDYNSTGAKARADYNSEIGRAHV